MKYELIIFDADDTLFDFKKAEKEAFKNTMLEFGLDYDESYHLKEYHLINDKMWLELEEGKISQEELKLERFSRFLDKININFIESKVFADKYMDNLSKGSFLFEGTAELIERLYGNYGLNIITNGLSRVQEGRIKKSDIAKYFENIIVSEEVKVSKPNPKIFEYALNGKNIDKKKILMVGDSLTSDIKGGINFGIDTCWINWTGKENGIVSPTYEISHILDLENILN